MIPTESSKLHMIHIKKRLKNIHQYHPPKWIILSLVVISTYFATRPTATKSISQALPRAQVTTLIPNGYSLVPILLENQQDLRSLVEDHAIVDLYSKKDRSDPLLIGKNVRLIRSPYDRNLFAALIPSQHSYRFASTEFRLFAILKKNQSGPTKIISTPSRRKIIYTKVEESGISDQISGHPLDSKSQEPL